MVYKIKNQKTGSVLMELQFMHFYNQTMIILSVIDVLERSTQSKNERNVFYCARPFIQSCHDVNERKILLKFGRQVSSIHSSNKDFRTSNVLLFIGVARAVPAYM